MRTGCELHRKFRSSGPWCPVCLSEETDKLLQQALDTLGQYWLDSDGYELMAHIRAHLARHEPQNGER